ncbi:MAG: head-tail connector protein [Propionivibrio sp.]
MSDISPLFGLDVDTARRHLRIDTHDFDDEIGEKLLAAIAIVHVYCKSPLTPPPYDLRDFYAMTDEERAAAIAEEKANWPNRVLDLAVFLVLAEIWQNREGSTSDPLSPTVKNLLSLFREPTYA